MFNKKPKPKLSKKWEGDYTTIKKHYKHIIFPIGGVALVGVTAAAIFLPLYIKAKAEAGLGNFMDEGGTVPAFKRDQPINYVAMGDSITAGYNGFFRGSDNAPQSKDYLSYADFLAQDLKNAGMLNSYKNYAKSGDTIWDTNELVTESQAVNHAIKEADYITISISSNDLLGAATALGLPFGTSLNKLMGNVQLPNHLRDAIHPNTNTGIAGADKNKLIADAMKKAVDVLYNGDIAGALDMRADYDKIILDVIKRGLMILTRDMHQAAPNAHIQFIMPEFPLIGISEKIENDPTPVTGKSVLEYFKGDFFKAVKEGIKAQFTSFTTFDNAFVDYANNIDKNLAQAKKVKEKYENDFKNQQIVQYIGARLRGFAGTVPTGFSAWNPPAEIPNDKAKIRTLSEAQLKTIHLSKDILDKLGVDNTKTIGEAISAYVSSFKNSYKGRDNSQKYYAQIKDVSDRYKSFSGDKTRAIIVNEFMNDFADIHPSVRGHQIMADYLFGKIMSKIDSKSESLESLYQTAVPENNDNTVDKFEEVDQIDWTKSTINGELHLVNKTLDKSTIATISRAINIMITQNPDGTKSPLSHILSIINPIINSDPQVSSDVYTISFDPSISGADAAYKVKGSTPGIDIQGFLTDLIKTSQTPKDELDSDDKFWVTLGTLLNQELVVSPKAHDNGASIATDLEKFIMSNNFDSDNVSGRDGLDSLLEVLKSNDIKKTGDYPGSKVIDWSKVPDTNKIKVDLENKPYLKTHIVTLSDLLSACDRSRTISNIKIFVVQKVHDILGITEDTRFPDLPNTYERGIAMANGWGLSDLATKIKNGETKLPSALTELLQAFADHSTMKLSDIKNAISMGLPAIIKYVKTIPNDAAIDGPAIDAAIAKYDTVKASSITMDEGFRKLFDILGV